MLVYGILIKESLMYAMKPKKILSLLGYRMKHLEDTVLVVTAKAEYIYPEQTKAWNQIQLQNQRAGCAIMYGGSSPNAATNDCVRNATTGGYS